MSCTVNMKNSHMLWSPTSGSLTVCSLRSSPLGPTVQFLNASKIQNQKGGGWGAFLASPETFSGRKQGGHQCDPRVRFTDLVSHVGGKFVGSLLCFERFFSGYSGIFSLLLKNQPTICY